MADTSVSIPSSHTQFTTNKFERVALYGRVSTANGQQDPEMQLRELRQFAEHRGWTVAREYVDHLSGAKSSRPAFNELMADAGRRKFDIVLVWKLDRLRTFT